MVHAFPSVHADPFGFAGFVHVPVDGLQVPAEWHWSLAVQTTGLVPRHAPAWQVSVRVQAFPSLQVTPSDLAGFVQTPVAESQVPAVWH